MDVYFYHAVNVLSLKCLEVEILGTNKNSVCPRNKKRKKILKAFSSLSFIFPRIWPPSFLCHFGTSPEMTKRHTRTGVCVCVCGWVGVKTVKNMPDNIQKYPHQHRGIICMRKREWARNETIIYEHLVPPRHLCQEKSSVQVFRRVNNFRCKVVVVDAVLSVTFRHGCV